MTLDLPNESIQILAKVLKSSMLTTPLIALFAGLFAAFGSAVFMFQSRHHGIDEHERKLQEKYEELLVADENNAEYCQNLLNQISIVRKRYNFALYAFILLMFQEIILIIAIIIISIYYKIIFWHLVFLILPGVIAFGLHIFGDLGLAFKTQAVSRKWLSNKTLQGSPLMVPQSSQIQK
jgi:hypothetical protein